MFAFGNIHNFIYCHILICIKFALDKIIKLFLIVCYLLKMEENFTYITIEERICSPSIILYLLLYKAIIFIILVRLSLITLPHNIENSNKENKINFI